MLGNGPLSRYIKCRNNCFLVVAQINLVKYETCSVDIKNVFHTLGRFIGSIGIPIFVVYQLKYILKGE